MKKQQHKRWKHLAFNEKNNVEHRMILKVHTHDDTHQFTVKAKTRVTNTTVVYSSGPRDPHADWFESWPRSEGIHLG